MSTHRFESFPHIRKLRRPSARQASAGRLWFDVSGIVGELDEQILVLLNRVDSPQGGRRGEVEVGQPVIEGC